MKIYFCPECGGYTLGPASSCDECQAELPSDSWADVTEEELQQLEYADDFVIPSGLPAWEYDVVKFKTDLEEGGPVYTSNLLKRMGDKGWELVDITTLDGQGNKYGIFKRAWEEGYQER